MVNKILPTEINIDCKTKSLSDFVYDDCTYLTLWHYNPKTKDLTQLPKIMDLKTLIINLTNIETLKGIEKFKNLERLELYYCRNLNSLHELSKIKNTLQYLQVDNAKKIQDYKILGDLDNLKVLALNKDAPIDNLDFILKLTSLEDLRFVNTNVKNGDLSPILRHLPLLKFVGFLNKRHYSHTESEINEYLGINKKEDYIKQISSDGSVKYIFK